MISLPSALVSEWTCPPEHLDALDDDWMKPAYLSFALLLAAKAGWPLLMEHRQVCAYTQLHTLQAVTTGLTG